MPSAIRTFFIYEPWVAINIGQNEPQSWMVPDFKITKGRKFFLNLEAQEMLASFLDFLEFDAEVERNTS